MTAPFCAIALPSDTVRFWNALVSRLLPARFSLDNGRPSAPVAHLTCPVAREDALGEGSAFTLYMNLNGFWRVEFGNLDVLALRPELDEWLRADAGNRFALLPEELVRAVLERLFLPLLDDISRHTGMPAIFVGAPRAGTRPMFTEHLDMVFRVDGERPINTLLRLAWQDAATLLPVLERLEAFPLPLSPPAALRAAHVAAPLVIGGMRLTPQELASLNTGDVLLPPALHPLEPRLRLAPDLRLVCSLNGATLSVRTLEALVTHISHGEQSMSNTVTENAAPQDAAQSGGQAASPVLTPDDMVKVELDITFELPGLRLPLAECSRLVPGHTFTLSAEAAHLPVTVLAGGSPVGVGRLVDVGGTVGVQITQMSGRATAMDGDAVKDGD